MIELLAPAGNREAFSAAIEAGADAIYLGGQQFGARQYADNFAADGKQKRSLESWRETRV